MDEPAILIEGLSKTYRHRGGRGELPFTARLNRRRARREGQVWEDDDDDFADEDEDLEPRDEPAEEEREVEALREVSLEVQSGSRLAVLGPPASGKSTLLKVLARITPPSAGRVVLRGRVAPLMGLASGVLEPSLTGRQNAYTVGRLFGVPREVVHRRLDAIFEFAGLADRDHLRAGAYSSGQYRRLGLSIALNLEPDILLVDERLVSGDSEFAAQCAERLSEMAKAGLTLLFAANDVETVRSYCTEAVMLQNGQISGRRPLEGVANEDGSRAAREARPWRYIKERPNALEALEASDRELLAGLARGAQTYESAARDAGTEPEALRKRAVALLSRLAPGGERIEPELHDLIVDYALGQGRAPGPELFAESPEARAWSRIVARQIGPLDAGPRPGLDAASGRYDGFEPPPDIRAKVFIDYLEVAIGPTRALEAVHAATDKAVWKEQASLKWQDIAEAAGFDHVEAKMISERLMERADLGRPALPDEKPEGPPVAIRGAAVRSYDGVAREWLGTDEPLHFDVKLDTHRPGLRLRCRIALEGQDGDPTTFSQDQPFDAQEPGRYVVTLRLPSGRLSEDHYFAHVAIEGEREAETGREEIEGATKRDVLRFDVREPVEPADDETHESEVAGEPVWYVAA